MNKGCFRIEGTNLVSDIALKTPQAQWAIVFLIEQSCRSYGYHILPTELGAWLEWTCTHWICTLMMVSTKLKITLYTLCEVHSPGKLYVSEMAKCKLVDGYRDKS